MEPERWQRIETLFHGALDCEADRRSEFIDSACGEDRALREEIESLLKAHDEENFTNSKAYVEGTLVLGRSQSLAGSRIGPYRILREIGEGGMGAVYLACRADDSFEKRVAVKVIRCGLDSQEIVQRFRSERQILAILEHPNIARLLDGGSTDEGLPYLVMEYIEGQPIDVYCNERKLNLPERLKLFQQVCTAISYAHRNLVIHRDVKPGNVMVTNDGVPRLLDFGIAKMLSSGLSATSVTATALHPLTPEYASPEQVRGEQITTASDVYSLGVLLYLLLTGRSPYRGAMSSPANIERSICEEPPERPSMRLMEGPADLDATKSGGKMRQRDGERQRGRQLRGDVDNIVLMALRKEPERRYSSVDQFSEDIERYLSRRPVVARPDTRAYRAARFIQRNKLPLGAVAVIFLILAGGIAATLWQAHVARKERDTARIERAKANRINTFLQEMIGFSNPAPSTTNRRGAHDATVEEMLDDAAQRVENELSDQPAVKAEMLATIGATYEAQAKYDRAGRYLREAYDLNGKLYGFDSMQTADVMHALASLSYLLGDYPAAAAWMQKALPIIRRHVHDPDTSIKSIVGVLSDAAFINRALGRLSEAEALWQESLVYAPRLPDQNRAARVIDKSYLAQLYIDRGDIAQADHMAAEASRELRAIGTDRFPLAQSLIDLGTVRSLEGRYSEAAAAIQEGTDLYAQVQGKEHPNVAHGLLNLAKSHFREGRYDLAERDARQALSIVAKLPNGHNLSSVEIALGRILARTGRLREAEPLLRNGLETARRTSPARSAFLAGAIGAMGEWLMASKRYVEAEPLLIESYEMYKSVQVPQSPEVKEARDRLWSLRAATNYSRVRIE